MVEIDIEYLGELRCEAKHGPSGITIITDAPADNMGKAESFSPTDLVATAIGTCIITTLGILAKQRDFTLGGAAARVTKEMTQKGTRRIAELRVALVIKGDYNDDQKQLLEAAAYACPVHNSLGEEVSVIIALKWRP